MFIITNKVFVLKIVAVSSTGCADVLEGHQSQLRHVQLSVMCVYPDNVMKLCLRNACGASIALFNCLKDSFAA